MVGDPMETTLAELAAWAGAAGRKHDATGAELLLRLLRDQVGVNDPGDLRPGDLDELLLEVYPRQVDVEGDAEITEVMSSVRELLAFLTDTGRLPASAGRRLDKEVDSIEPEFADAMRDPTRWGPARAISNAMLDDGIDLTDTGAVQTWIDRYNATLPANPFDADDEAPLEDELDEDVDLKELLGLPDRLPPIRVPPEDELAAIARGTELLGRAKRLASWAVERRVITDDLLAGAAQVLGVGEEELVLLWELCVELEFVEQDGDVTVFGPDADAWPDGDDDAVLETWQTALAIVLASGTETPEGLDFTSGGVAVAISLFLSGGAGAAVDDLNEMIQEAATAGMAPVAGAKAMRAWVAEHGEPVDNLMRLLGDLGAVEVADGVATLLPLCRFALREQLVDMGVDVPLAPPVAQMTATDLVAFAEMASKPELDAEATAWLAARDPGAAVAELLTVAATAGPAERVVATSIAARQAASTEDRWRQVLDNTALRPYAKIALAQVAGVQPQDAPPDLVPSPADLAWLFTDTLASIQYELTPGDVGELWGEAVPPGEEQRMLDQMWRLDHPYAQDVLTLIGTHPDRAIAKAARKASFKARSRAGQR